MKILHMNILIVIAKATLIIEFRSIDERTVRKFEKPIINFDAEEYFDLIDNEGTWLESVLTKHISSSCFTDYINNIVPVISFPPYSICRKTFV